MGIFLSVVYFLGVSIFCAIGGYSIAEIYNCPISPAIVGTIVGTIFATATIISMLGCAYWGFNMKP